MLQSVNISFDCERFEPRNHFMSRLIMIIRVNNNPVQDCVHPDDHTHPTYEIGRLSGAGNC